MAFRKMFLNDLLLYEELGGYCFGNFGRFYATKVDLRKLRPMILKRIEKRSRLYPVRSMVPVANEVLLARSVLIHGVSTLLNSLPLMACKWVLVFHYTYFMFHPKSAVYLFLLVFFFCYKFESILDWLIWAFLLVQSLLRRLGIAYDNVLDLGEVDKIYFLRLSFGFSKDPST